MSSEPTPIAKAEEIRRDTVARLRRVADELERAPRHAAADVLVRIMEAVGQIERWVQLLLRRGQGPGAA